ncbi:MAG: hypothetical protein SPiBPW_30460 [Shewanella algae]
MISILIVEDDNCKFENVRSIIEELGISSDEISRTSSVQETLDVLKDMKYDILVLDLKLPQIEGGEKKDTGGLNVLKAIRHDIRKRGDKYKTPNIIIGLTEHTELFKEQAELFTEQRVFSYVYNNIDMSWANGVKESISDYIHSKQSSVITIANKKIIYSIHGIMSFGKWQNNLDDYIREQGCDYEHIEFKYNFYPLISFLLPPMRKREVNAFIIELQDLANRNRKAEINIIAHSFGTFVAVKALERISKLKSPQIGKVILCGSVLKSSHQLQKVIQKHSIKGVINDCGITDRALVLSQCAAIGLGMAGRVGFKNTFNGFIHNRFFNGGHGLFFNEAIFKDWLDFISGKNLEKQDDREDPGIWTSIKATFVVYSPIIGLSSLIFLGYKVLF